MIGILGGFLRLLLVLDFVFGASEQRWLNQLPQRGGHFLAEALFPDGGVLLSRATNRVLVLHLESLLRAQ